MTPAEFRRLALAAPGARESAHMGHPDFRVGGKIFASLGYPDENWGMVKLTPDQQRAFMRKAPRAFSPSNGAWGRQGSTAVHLPAAKPATTRAALVIAAKNLAPKPWTRPS